MLKECSYQLFVYSINKCFCDSVIEIAKYLIESLIIKQCGKIYLYLIFLRSRYENATPNLCWVFCALLGVLCN